MKLLGIPFLSSVGDRYCQSFLFRNWYSSIIFNSYYFCGTCRRFLSIIVSVRSCIYVHTLTSTLAWSYNRILYLYPFAMFSFAMPPQDTEGGGFLRLTGHSWWYWTGPPLVAATLLQPGRPKSISHALPLILHWTITVSTQVPQYSLSSPFSADF